MSSGCLEDPAERRRDTRLHLDQARGDERGAGVDGVRQSPQWNLPDAHAPLLCHQERVEHGREFVVRDDDLVTGPEGRRDGRHRDTHGGLCRDLRGPRPDERRERCPAILGGRIPVLDPATRAVLPRADGRSQGTHRVTGRSTVCGNIEVDASTRRCECGRCRIGHGIEPLRCAGTADGSTRSTIGDTLSQITSDSGPADEHIDASAAGRRATPVPGSRPS